MTSPRDAEVVPADGRLGSAFPQARDLTAGDIAVAVLIWIFKRPVQYMAAMWLTPSNAATLGLFIVSAGAAVWLVVRAGRRPRGVAFLLGVAAGLAVVGFDAVFSAVGM